MFVTESARTNFSLGSENYKNNDYCAAYPYLKWLLANDPLFSSFRSIDFPTRLSAMHSMPIHSICFRRLLSTELNSPDVFS